MQIITALLVAIYTLLTYRLVQTTSDQVQVALGQLDSMRNEQRPWIPVPEIFVTGPVLFSNREDPWIPFGIKVKNIGHSPASNVTERFQVQIVTKNRVFEAVDEEKRLCEAAAKDASEDQFRGRFLFPGDESVGLGGGGGADPKEIPLAWPNPRDVLFRIIGCIDYTFADTPKIHGQTGFSYNLSMPTDGGVHRNGFDPANGDVPVSQMLFEQDYFHAGYIR